VRLTSTNDPEICLCREEDARYNLKNERKKKSAQAVQNRDSNWVFAERGGGEARKRYETETSQGKAYRGSSVGCRTKPKFAEDKRAPERRCWAIHAPGFEVACPPGVYSRGQNSGRSGVDERQVRRPKRAPRTPDRGKALRNRRKQCPFDGNSRS